ncbi:MAG: tripartite tricarboxylate transporter permease [Candidatus Hydrothermarchaeales archaeon]
MSLLNALLFTLIGILLGTFTGLVPGIHVNTVAIVVISLLPILLENFSRYDIVALIIAMAVVHTYVDYIPSVVFGAPEESSILSVLPGHKLLLKGRGYDAIRLTVIGSLGATMIGCAVLPLGILVFPILYFYTRKVIHILLFLILSYMVYTEGGSNRKLSSVFVIIYSGILGILILNYGILNPKYALFPTLTGLFGISTLLTSLRTQPHIPPQELTYSEESFRKGVLLGSLGGIFSGLLPSVGSSQIALMAQGILGRGDDREFLVALGGINTSNAIYALLALYLIGNPRSGASIAVEQIMGTITSADLLFMISVVLISSSFAVFITLKVAKVAVRNLEYIDYRKFTMGILVFLVVMILYLTRLKGLLIAITATAIGLICPFTGIKRSHCMAVLIIPTMMYFMAI